MRAHYSRLRTDQWANDPEYRRKTVDGIKLSKGSPEARAMFSALLTERWQNPEWRAKWTRANEARNTPELRAKNAARMKARWEDESWRAFMLASMKLYAESPESRAAKSLRMKQLWADPIWAMRQKTLIGMSKGPAAAAAAAAAASATSLMAAIDRVVPRALPDFIRGDVCQDLMVALLEGNIKLKDLKEGAKTCLSDYRRMYPDKFGPLSLDAPIPGTDGLTIMDTLADDAPHF